MRFSSSQAIVAAILPFAYAQTYTDCNPTQKSCPANPGLKASSLKTDFKAGANPSWSALEGTYLKYGNQGAEFTINVKGNAPTMSSNFYILFGRVEVRMKAAPGKGVISSIVLESDDLDEIDWEFVGGDYQNAQTNYYGKGNTTTYDRAKYIPLSPPPQQEFHTYTLDWTAERCQYIIDGQVVRTVNYQDAVGGKNYPQTPMRVKLGNWTPPDSAKGTIDWAGGPVDFSQAPFTMYVDSVTIQNYNPAGSYIYGDMSGSWQSIKIDGQAAGAGGSSSAVSSAVGTGKPTSVPDTATRGPTSTLSVAPIQQTQAAVSKTVILANGTSTTLGTSSRTASATTTPTNNAAAAVVGSSALLWLAAGAMLF